MSERNQPVCGPSIEPFKEWARKWKFNDSEGHIRDAIAAYDALRSENERLKGEVEAARQERNAEGVRQRGIYLPKLQAHKDALKKAKVLLNESQPPWSNPVFYSHTLENASWRYRRESLIATINSLNL